MKIIITTKPDMEKALVLKNVCFCGATSFFFIMDLYDTKVYQTVVYVEHMIHLADDSYLILQISRSGGTSTCDSIVNRADGCNTGIYVANLSTYF